MYDIADLSWTDISSPAFGTPPSPRNAHGFAALGSMLYMVGGGSDKDCIFQYCYGLSLVALVHECQSFILYNSLGYLLCSLLERVSLLYVRSFADNLNDLHIYDPSARTWTDRSVADSGIQPSPRNGHGFITAAGRLFVQGGWDGNGATTN